MLFFQDLTDPINNPVSLAIWKRKSETAAFLTDYFQNRQIFAKYQYIFEKYVYLNTIESYTIWTRTDPSFISFTSLPRILKLLLMKEIYLFGCGGKIVNSKHRTTILACAFFPSFMEQRSLPYISVQRCNNDCQQCKIGELKAEVCDQFNCELCELVCKRKKEKLCSKLNQINHYD